MSLVTLLVIAVALALPLIFYLALENLRILSGGFDDPWQVSVYLHPRLDEKAARSVAAQLKAHPAVAAVRLIGKQAALETFRRHSGFDDVLEALPENPLPVVVEVTPRDAWTDTARLQKAIEAWRKMDGVDFIQWDMGWVQRLKAWLALAERSMRLLGALLSLTVLLVVGNTVRLALEERHEEVEIMKLLGATHRFIRRPFLYSGFWFGFFGGGLALTLGWGVYRSLTPQVLRLAELYGGSFRLRFLSPVEASVFWGMAILLGIAGAWLVVTRHLWRQGP